MTKFTFKSLSYGWEKANTPDTIEYVLQTDDGDKYEMMASLQQLAILYDSIVTESDCSFYMGTGTPVEVVTSKGKMVITIGNVQTTKTTEKLLENLESLLSNVFEGLNRKNSSAERERQLEQINRHLREYYGGTDFKSLYYEIT